MKKKTRFRSSDSFDIEDEYEREQLFRHCLKAALECEFEMISYMEKPILTLRLGGTKTQFLKYYIKTSKLTTIKCNGLKRVLRVLFTWW